MDEPKTQKVAHFKPRAGKPYLFTRNGEQFAVELTLEKGREWISVTVEKVNDSVYPDGTTT